MILEILQAIFGLVLVLFLPGFVATYVIFPKDDEIDEVERFALSFGLSIAIVPLMVFALSIIGIPINLVNIVLEIVILITVLVAIFFYQQPEAYNRWQQRVKTRKWQVGKKKPAPKKKPETKKSASKKSKKR
jgi:uncharacterized membrane protein